jgi:tetratricopeptide (TPR) repeat protein
MLLIRYTNESSRCGSKALFLGRDPPSMPRRPSRRARRTDQVSSATALLSRQTSGRWIGATVGLVMLTGVAASWILSRPTLRQTAIQAEKDGHWPAALSAWREINQTEAVSARSLLGEASAALALGRAGQAERVLQRATRIAPANPEAWLLWLEILRLEDRPLEARRVGEAALSVVPPESQREVLKALTLALLADAPDDLARDTLKRWIASDPADPEARVAWLRRVAADPRPDDPSAAARAAELSALLDRDPNHAAVREALVITLAEAGDPVRGRVILDAWPKLERDARYDRLVGRWNLDYDRPNRPSAAAESFRRALIDLPHDWRTHYGLARALSANGQDAESRREADLVARLRETLEPTALGRRLDDDFARLDSPDARRDLAALCDHVGLVDLAAVWRRDAEFSSSPALPSGVAPLVPSHAGHRPGR